MRLLAAWKRVEPQLRRLAERMCRSHADAADLVQDTFERAANVGIPIDVRNSSAWLTTTMHHLFIDRCRAEARRPVHEELTATHDGIVQHHVESEPAWCELSIDDVRAALLALEPIFREVYAMYTFERRSYEAIAARLGVDRVTVGTRLSRARKRLREVLSNRRETKP
ncbi:MAG TPA: RNA polymerase sigma factor [Kofleriaceae bacterium]|nr:RNA polymerase sigma factor [Kofleriaceae bacterium]